MNIKKLTNSGLEGYQIFDEQGNEYFLTEATEQLAIEKHNAIKEMETKREYERLNPPPLTYQELRQKEYPSTDDMVVALWEWQVEGRIESKDLLQAKRETIKLKYPKNNQ